MSRYEIENIEVGPGPYDITGTWKTVIYGFERVTGYFIQGYRPGRSSPNYYDSGGKSVILDSPFWADIEASNPDHALKIALDLPF